MNYPTEVVDPSTFTNNVWRYLTPTTEKQQEHISKGECPHNQGFRYEGHSHNDDCYQCITCGKHFWY